jgi:hypothetical protein
MKDIDSLDYNDTNLGDPRETPDERRIRELEAEVTLLRQFKLAHDSLLSENAALKKRVEEATNLFKSNTFNYKCTKNNFIYNYNHLRRNMISKLEAIAPPTTTGKEKG